ncbi:hypothetical protein WR164_05410 [Philodulcilactobacillus myokoensis]|uniref:HTH marR-type domain-containing protein n=1 Tax=Philodulcilactobacillus myokoensis TaxID=2929573 RepID=A0A9W6B072_9LACO|nr:MarR family winged helix-turn-helix transcriptional regulator [Philodulcilactobacillus myokoensis]GLB46562.1 hypothetical protein WR164_05410 [Philodulcilactobacillus myokoensis]
MRRDFARLLKSAATQLTKQFNQFAKRYDMTATQMAIIDFMTRTKKKEFFQSDIEHEFWIQRSTASVLLKRMEARKLIIRTSSLEDARQKQVILTSKARQLENTIVDFMNKQQAQIEDHFSVQEVETVRKFLKFIINFENKKK